MRKMFLKKIHYFFVSASFVLFLANIVVLYYGIARYSSLSGGQVEDISTEETAEGCSSSLRMECT